MDKDNDKVEAEDLPGGDLPGREIPQDYRQVALELVRNQKWRYDNGKKTSTYPRLFPADRSKNPVKVPKTPSDRRGFKNWVSEIRRAGGKWPPERRAK